MTFYIGVDYYPEHWAKSKWDEYAVMMHDAGFNVVRLAEFAWALMEPSEGVFDFEWLDEAIQVLNRHELSIILGTPTASMPAWVKDKYPEVMASSDGTHRDAWGARKNNCFTSGTFRRLSERITLAMAQRYGHSSLVIGWQTDNEIDGPHCRCHSCRAEFRVFLTTKYGDIATLNDAWGTRFWGHCYSAWSEIDPPSNQYHDNPSLCLDWQRFETFVQVRFQRDQVQILREHCPSQFITHNYMGTGNNSNCYDLAEDMDFASFDCYPGFPGSKTIQTQGETGFACDLTRGLKGKNFWIMETTAGPTGWGEFSRNIRPGEMRKNFFHHVAHGADGQLFFRWRTCTSGREQYWHGLLGHDGKAGRRYAEAAQLAHEVRKIETLLADSTVNSQVAFVYDYDSRWATGIQPSFPGNDYVKSTRRYYDALMRQGVNIDVVPLSADLSKYRVVVASQLHVLADADAERLNNFVADGGILLADIRTGVKTPTNLCHQRTLPGLLSTSLGIEIDEYEAVVNEYGVQGSETFPGDFAAHQYADWIRTTGAEPLGFYTDWHVGEYPIATRHRFGKGVGYYVGTIVKGDEFYDSLMRELLETAGIVSAIKPPAGIEVTARSTSEHDLLFVINHSEETVTIPVGREMVDVLTGQMVQDSLSLDRFGVAILKCDH